MKRYYAQKRQSWELDRWIYLNESIYNRSIELAYLEKYEKCEEDLLLPRDLVTQYFDGGKNLKCPSGTTSERASWCLG